MGECEAVVVVVVEGRSAAVAAVDAARQRTVQQGEELGSVHVGEEVQGSGIRVALVVKDAEKVGDSLLSWDELKKRCEKWFSSLFYKILQKYFKPNYKQKSTLSNTY